MFDFWVWILAKDVRHSSFYLETVWLAASFKIFSSQWTSWFIARFPAQCWRLIIWSLACVLPGSGLYSMSACDSVRRWKKTSHGARVCNTFLLSLVCCQWSAPQQCPWCALPCQTLHKHHPPHWRSQSEISREGDFKAHKIAFNPILQQENSNREADRSSFKV